MCTGIVETARIWGGGKGPSGWFSLTQAAVSYDHPFYASAENTLNIDFVNEGDGAGARVAVELDAGSARALVRAIEAALQRGMAAEMG